MGCCPSREPSQPQSPRNASVRDASRPTTPGTPPEGVLSIDESTLGDINRGTTSTARWTNNSLRVPKAWRSTSRAWTKQQLAREREIFWETQVTGRDEVWAALRLAVDMLNGTGDERQPDPKGAKAVIEAAGCTCPTGRLGEGVWDEQGRLYKLPRWLLSDPVNVVRRSRADEEEDDIPEDDVEDEDEGKDNEFYGETEGIDKGKDKMPTGANAITVTARMSDRGTDLKIVVTKDQSVRNLLRRIQAECEISTNIKLKIAYMGRVLKDSETLIDQGWKPGHVVNVLVFNQ